MCIYIYICMYISTYIYIIIYIWVNYNISLTWIKANLGMIPLINHEFQWGRSEVIIIYSIIYIYSYIIYIYNIYIIYYIILYIYIIHRIGDCAIIIILYMDVHYHHMFGRLIHVAFGHIRCRLRDKITTLHEPLQWILDINFPYHFDPDFFNKHQLCSQQ